MPLKLLDRHTTLITINQRLARVLRGEYDRARLAAGEGTWESPDILSYPLWLQRCWYEFAAGSERPVPALLSADQDLSLWEQVISAHAPADGEVALLQIGEAARDAQAAWALLRAWGRLADGQGASSSAETRAFRAWAREYESLCRRGNWIDLASIGDRVREEGVQAIVAAGTRRVLLAGFDAATPQQQALFTALAASGIAVEHREPPQHRGEARLFAFANEDDELECAARWARRCIEDGAPGPVGIVVPGFAGSRHRVAAAFEDVFAPGAGRPGTPTGAQAFNISLGQPLAEVPVVCDALLCLRAMGGQLSLRDAGRWLLSPYLGGGGLGWRARLDAELRRIGETRFTLARLRELSARLDHADRSREGEAAGGAGARFAAFLEGLQSRAVSGVRRHALRDWAAQFASWLNDSGWPGERALSSDEHQAVQACRELLASFSALAPVVPAVDFPRALSHLEWLAARQLFQPRSGGAPVQILGVLEALAVDYSHLWLSGLHHQAWPEPARPNPFLPVGLQRELGMPRAGSEQQLEWARAWTARMLASANQVIVSYPRQIGDETLRPSALIAHLPAAGTEALAMSDVPGDAMQVHEAAPELETFVDDRAPAVAAGRTVRGGVSVFRDQAACPFKAFAVHRLGAADVAAPDSSLDPRVRGNIAHRLLELVWRELDTQSRLLSLGVDERERIIRNAAERALAEEARQRPHTLRGRLLALEQQRLEILARAWLDIEAGRAPVEVQAETNERVSVAGLPVTLRPDRLDRLDDGHMFLVDYKTGQCDPKDWFGERPDEPQLPVYALAMDDSGEGRVAGIAFGSLRPGKLGYRGLGGRDDLAPGVDAIAASRLHGAREAADWEAHKALWRERLSRIADDYLQGDARVDPKTPGVTCRFCRLQVLCRVHEQ